MVGPAVAIIWNQWRRCSTTEPASIRFEQRGCGRSEAAPPYDVETCLTDLENIRFRMIQVEDLQLAHTLWINTEVRRFLFDDRVIALDEARALIEASIKNFEERGYGLWLAFSRGTGMLVGFAGFISSSDDPNLVYGVHPEFCGSGFATEAATAVLDYAFQRSVVFGEGRRRRAERNIGANTG